MSEELITWSKFKLVYKSEKGDWLTDFIYYMGDLSGVDFANDWRFKEVEGKRKQVQFIELVQKPKRW